MNARRMQNAPPHFQQNALNAARRQTSGQRHSPMCNSCCPSGGRVISARQWHDAPAARYVSSEWQPDFMNEAQRRHAHWRAWRERWDSPHVRQRGGGGGGRCFTAETTDSQNQSKTWTGSGLVHTAAWRHGLMHEDTHTHTHTHTLSHTHTHTHTCWFLWFMGTLHRLNGFYTEQTVCAIALHLPYT